MDSQEIRSELIRVSPAGAVSVTSIMGIPLSDWVYIVTIIYIFVQCACLIYKTLKKREEKKDAAE